MIFTILAAVGAGAIFFLFTQPLYATAQQQQAQIAQYNAALDKAAEMQQLKQSLLSKYNAFDPNSLDRLQKLLPDHVDNIALILELNALAERYGLALQNVDVSNSGNSSAAGDQSALGAVGGSSQLYDSLTLHFATQGTYSTFLQFMNDLESSLRVVDLQSLTVAAASSGGASAVPQYTYTIVLKTYWLK